MAPRFAAFKRMYKLADNGYEFNEISENLEMAEKLSIKIDRLIINTNRFDDLKELYKDKDANLIIEYLETDYDFVSKGLIEDFEFINKISPKILTIKWNKWTVESIKALTLINCANFNTKFDTKIKIDCYILFENTPIQLFDSNSGQMFIFEWESIKIFIEINEFDDEYELKKNSIGKVKLLKTNTGNFLFIPLNTILQIQYLGFREISKTDNIYKQFADLGVQHQFKENGLIIPMGYSNRIFIDLNDKNLDYLNQYKNIYKIFKEKQIELTIHDLGRLLEISKLLPDDFSRINFKYYNYDKLIIEEYLISLITNNLNWSNLKFKEICQSSTLSPDGFQFWWMMLRLRRTKFNITSIDLKLSLLSECLSILTLCLNCPELKSVKLRYEEEDIKYKDEVIENAQRQFRQEFGFIQEVEIRKCLNDFELKF